MSPTLWPFTGHTVGPHHITAAARNSQILGKRGKKHKGGGRGGEKSRKGWESVLGLEGGLQKQRQKLKTKFTTEGKQQG